MLRPWTSMPPTQCEANCTAAAVWRRSRRDPAHIRALRGPRWDAGIARDGCVGVLLSAVSRPCGQGITWPRTSTTHKTSTILNAIPLPVQRDQHGTHVAYVIDSTGANARPARREAWVPQQCGPWALLCISPGPATVSFRPQVRNCPVHCSRSQPQSAFGRCHAISPSTFALAASLQSQMCKARARRVRSTCPASTPSTQHTRLRSRTHAARRGTKRLRPHACLSVHSLVVVAVCPSVPPHTHRLIAVHNHCSAQHIIPHTLRTYITRTHLCTHIASLPRMHLLPYTHSCFRVCAGGE